MAQPITTSLDPAARIVHNVQHFKAMLLKRPTTAGGAAANARPNTAAGSLQRHQTIWGEAELADRAAAIAAARAQLLTPYGRPPLRPRSAARAHALDQLTKFGQRYAAEYERDDDDDRLSGSMSGSGPTSPANPAAKVPPRTAAPGQLMRQVVVATQESVALKYLLLYQSAFDSLSRLPRAQIDDVLCTLSLRACEKATRGGAGDAVLALPMPKFLALAETVIADAALCKSFCASFDVFHEGWAAFAPTVALLKCVSSPGVSAALKFLFVALATHGANLTVTDHRAIHRWLQQHTAGGTRFRSRAIDLIARRVRAGHPLFDTPPTLAETLAAQWGASERAIFVRSGGADENASPLSPSSPLAPRAAAPETRRDSVPWLEAREALAGGFPAVSAVAEDAAAFANAPTTGMAPTVTPPPMAGSPALASASRRKSSSATKAASVVA